jgi:NADH-quinone oxidoreductase subunit J
MNLVFYISAAVAIVATFLVITRTNAVHAILYLVVGLLAVSVSFFVLGAPFIAALEVMIYAGAIMVLFVFAVMLLNLGKSGVQQERAWLSPGTWIGPALLAVILIGELTYMMAHGAAISASGSPIEPKELGLALYGPYLLGVELASILLLAGLVGAYHLAHRNVEELELPKERRSLT